MEAHSLEAQVKCLSATFKSNLGSFLSRVQQQANAIDASGDIETLLTDLDKVISNQKQLSELIQRVKVHQKVSRELDKTDDSIKLVQSSILSVLEEHQQRDLILADRLVKAESLQNSLNSLEYMINDPEGTIIASTNFAFTASAPTGWNPSMPLHSHRPPYPTEDLIRRSALYQLMVSSVMESKGQEPCYKESTSSSIMEVDSRDIPVFPSSSIRGRRKTTTADKSKLLDFDLNPDL